MRITKSSIKKLLNEWNQLIALNNIDVLEYLLPIEGIINHLLETGQLSEEEMLILDAYKMGFNHTEISRILKISKQTALNKMNRICNLILSMLDDNYV